MNKEVLNLCEALNSKLANIASGFSILKECYVTHGILKHEMMVSRRTGETVADYMSKLPRYINEAVKLVEAAQRHEVDTSCLKPFNINSAKSGAPICTRDGRRARLLCVDAKNDYDRCVVALVTDGYGESPICYNSEGRYNTAFEDDSDLFMLSLNREGWINIYDQNETGQMIYPSKEEALSNSDKELVVDTIKIEWEE